MRNKGAYDIYLHNLQNHMSEAGEPMRFAVAFFDCDNLKHINDEYGHDKGDAYLKAASKLICRVFQHSPVFRTGGDEFAAILQNEDYDHRDALCKLFQERCAESIMQSRQPWEQISVAMGVAEYDPEHDFTVSDVARRADRLMYEDKHARKAER